MEAQSLGSHQHSWWFSCFSLREKLARSHNKRHHFWRLTVSFILLDQYKQSFHLTLSCFPLQEDRHHFPEVPQRHLASV